MAKKKKGRATVQKPFSEEWAVVKNDMKKKKRKSTQEGKGEKTGKHSQPKNKIESRLTTKLEVKMSL